eukprot:jgi/Hompol1/6949/HPOL_005130-RA
MFEQESYHFEESQSQIYSQIQEASASIEKLKAELAAAQLVKLNRMEYDEIAAEILKLTSRERTERYFEEIQEEIARLEIDRREIIAAKEFRIKSFSSVVASIIECQEAIKDGSSGAFAPMETEADGTTSVETASYSKTDRHNQDNDEEMQ